MLTDKQLEELRLRLLKTWDEVAGMELPEDARNRLGGIKNDTLALWLCTAQVIREHSNLRETLHTLSRELVIQMEEYGIVKPETQEEENGIQGNTATEESGEITDVLGQAEQALSE